MKRIFCLLLLTVMVCISSVCLAVAPEVMRYHRTYTNSLGFWQGYSEAVFESIEKDDLATLARVRSKANDDSKNQAIVQNLQLLAKAAEEKGNGVPANIFQAFRNAWYLKHKVTQPIMERIIFSDAEISAWSQADKNQLAQMLRESEQANQAYFRLLLNAGVPR